MSYTPSTYWVYPAGCWVDLNTGNIIPTANIASFTNKVQLTKWVSSGSVGNTVWVSKLGDNSYGNGTPEMPFRTINWAITQLSIRNASGCVIVDEMNGSPWNEALYNIYVNSKKFFFNRVNSNSITVFDWNTANWYNLINGINGIGYISWDTGTSYVFNSNIKQNNNGCIISGYNSVISNTGTITSLQNACPAIGCIMVSSFFNSRNNASNTIYVNSGCTPLSFFVISYSSLINFYYRLDAIPTNALYGIVASQWSWLTNAWILYDGAALQSSASISPNRMYKITSNPNSTSIAGISSPSISATAVGTFFCTSSTASEITRNGLVLEMQSHDLQALRDRNWRRFAVNIGTDIKLNFYGCQVFPVSHDPFIDSANGNYTLKPGSWEATSGPNFEPIGAMGVGKLINTSDIWQSEPMQNVTIVSATQATMDTTNLSRFKTNVFNWVGMKLKNLDLLRLDNAVNGEWFAVDSNYGAAVTALTVGNWYINASSGVPITLAGSNRVISVNQPFCAQSGETSFTGASTVYAVNLRKLCVRLRISQSAFTAADTTVPWFKFSYGQQALVNKVGNVDSGAITAGTGDDSFDPTVALPLGAFNYFQFEVICQKNEMKGI